jgi:hypothetical protein
VSRVQYTLDAGQLPRARWWGSWFGEGRGGDAATGVVNKCGVRKHICGVGLPDDFIQMPRIHIGESVQLRVWGSCDEMSPTMDTKSSSNGKKQ